MAKDAELDRLKAAQDAAFHRKQEVYQAQQRAWDRRCHARQALNDAHEKKQRSYDAQDSSWQEYQQLCARDGPRIDQLRARQEAAFQNMQRAFDSASAAHDRRDGAAARRYADEGHNYKAESQRYVNERRQLVDELRSAKARHEPYKLAFQHAKIEFDSAKRIFDQAKREHERQESDFQDAKSGFDQASAAFKSRLGQVQAENKKRHDDRCLIAEKAGVPHQYRDDVWISTDSEGNTNIYFGGVGKPNGPGHGHYVMNRNGTVTYRRNPFDPHGTQNFEGSNEDNHGGGFGKSMHGWIGGSPVTFALGWGTKDGHTLIADGHLSHEHFRESAHHDHYGRGDGPNYNGTLRHKYTGPDA
ncbi:hypothetical protein [Mycobacteroides abscessus]|uniref:hypothetical protein n=1 Tax=Mycobacteroides abscessus TaxID=36809 RepID=UPI002102F9A7|nr:hypothetical protein [Mycobacteroides abscessus]